MNSTSIPPRNTRNKIRENHDVLLSKAIARHTTNVCKNNKIPNDSGWLDIEAMMGTIIRSE